MTPIERMVDSVVKCVKCGMPPSAECSCFNDELLADEMFKRFMKELVPCETVTEMARVAERIIEETKAKL
jgi:hypothetical protein